MITVIIELLQSDAHYGVSEEVERAKGKYKLTTNPTDVANKIKRGRKLNKKQP